MTTIYDLNIWLTSNCYISGSSDAAILLSVLQIWEQYAQIMKSFHTHKFEDEILEHIAST